MRVKTHTVSRLLAAWRSIEGSPAFGDIMSFRQGVRRQCTLLRRTHIPARAWVGGMVGCDSAEGELGKVARRAITTASPSGNGAVPAAEAVAARKGMMPSVMPRVSGAYHSPLDVSKSHPADDLGRLLVDVERELANGRAQHVVTPSLGSFRYPAKGSNAEEEAVSRLRAFASFHRDRDVADRLGADFADQVREERRSHLTFRA